MLELVGYLVEGLLSERVGAFSQVGLDGLESILKKVVTEDALFGYGL